jgi:hypothetical protein
MHVLKEIELGHWRKMEENKSLTGGGGDVFRCGHYQNHNGHYNKITL